MSIKFAKEIVNEIKKRGAIKIPEGNVSGEEFEKWLMFDYYMDSMCETTTEKVIVASNQINEFTDNYGEAA